MQDRRATVALLLASLLALPGCAPGTRPAQPPTQAAPSAAAPVGNPLKNAYFGDLHLHTRLSLDAYLYDIDTSPDDAFRYARGEAVQYLGREVRRRTPLDFLAVTDHAEFLGVLEVMSRPGNIFEGTQWHRLLTSGNPQDLRALFRRLNAERPAEFREESLLRNQWQIVIDAAQAHYRPGRFTTFVAYEWSSTPGGRNQHRNVIFAGPAFPDRPFSYLDSEQPEDLWSWLETERGRGIDALAIPHNSNLSDGMMFASVDSQGEPLSREYAIRRMRNEPDIEITQAKGTSETTPELSPADELAAFELYRYMLGSQKQGRVEGSYVRQALARGIEIRERIGLNPFKYGFVGASDFHSGVSSTEEDNYVGGHGRGDSVTSPSSVLTGGPLNVGAPPVSFSASGVTGVWAEANTRESIFAALRRKETFATSGTRINVRMFAGWRYPQGTIRNRDWIAAAYANGVPMGADLPPRPADASSPRFLLTALKDPDAAHLDRIQIVKVWFEEGQAGERVFDVAWSGNRKPDAGTGRVPSVGSTVDLQTATYRNSIGAAQLTAEWTDPEFDPAVPAVYYARVLEIPTPRWSTYLAVRNNLPLPAGVPSTIQERAWTSPVFYEPGAGQ